MDSFDGPIKAKTGRYLGNAILTEAMERDGRLSFKSYDRFFPNQDFMTCRGLRATLSLCRFKEKREKTATAYSSTMILCRLPTNGHICKA